ncbi:tetratricopeptide repeat protein [Microcoleus sp. B5-D4]|uniref:tetratricopeptide repeat protein n=1 Tax=unclassified Microcoleus TaxID=2642155 RepID=UPI002FD1676A
MEAKKNAVDYLDEGARLVELGSLEEAIAAFRRAIELNPDLSWSHHNLGEALAKLGQFEEAIAAYRHAIELNPDFSWSYHHLGDALERQEQWQEAVVAFCRAIELNAEHFGTYCGLGHSLAKLGQLDEAIAAYRRASELNPETDWIQYKLGELLQQRTQLDLEGAISSYRGALQLNPNDLEACRNLLEIQPHNSDNLEESQAFRINPQQLKLISGQLLQTGGSWQLVSREGNQGQVSYGPYITLPDGLYRVIIDCEFPALTSEQKRENSEIIGFKLDVAMDQSLVVYQENIYTHQQKQEFFIDLVNVKDLEVRFWAMGQLFAVNFIEFTLVYHPGEDAKAIDYYLKVGNNCKNNNMVRAIYSFQQAFKIKKASVTASSNKENIEIYPQPVVRKPRIYDCFPFFNEIDILKIRIEELKDVVDKFILVEATKTHSGQLKPLYFKEFIHEFAEYQDQIIHYIVDDMPEVQNNNRWPLENYQRDCIGLALIELECQDEDIILVSDADEIPRKDKINEAIQLLSNNDFVIFTHDLYAHNLDNLQSEWWCGTLACKYKNLKQRTATQVRRSDAGNFASDSKAGYINESRNFGHPYIAKGGWSFTWFGTPLSNSYKIQSFAHAEVDDSDARGVEKLKYDICRPTLEFEASGEYYFDLADIEGKDVPEYLKKNIHRYRHFLKAKPTNLTQAYAVLEQKQTKLQQVIDNYNQMWEKIVNHGDAVSVINDWRRLSDLGEESPHDFFLSSLKGICSWCITPDQLTLISGQLIDGSQGKQLVSNAGNQGQVSYGPYISVPDGVYRVKIELDREYSQSSLNSVENSQALWFKFDVAIERSLVIYESSIYCGQKDHELFIDFVNAIDLEIRFWSVGAAFAVNSIEMTLIYQPRNDATATEYYFNLGKSLQIKGQQQQALAAYRRAAELNPHNYLAKAIASSKQPEAYTELISSLIKQGLLEQVISCYDQLFENDWNLATKAHHNLAIVLAKEGMMNEAITVFSKSSKKTFNESLIYENIWLGLNKMRLLDEDNPDYPTEIDREDTYKYFSQTSQYKALNISALSDEERNFMEKAGFSIANLELIAKDDIELEEIYINSFTSNEPVQLSRKGGKDLRGNDSIYDIKKGRYFQQSIVETGYIYSVCPSTGEVLRTNQSFVYHYPHPGTWTGVHPIYIYRFVGVEVFYLVCATPVLGDKSFIYFPNRELIITFVSGHDCYAKEDQIINALKANFVSHWQLVNSYLSTDIRKEVAAVLGYMNNLAHFVWNELSGIQYLYDNETLDKIDKFLIGSFEYFNLGDTYPEIPIDKILHLTNPDSLFETILANNYLAVWSTDLVIKEDLSNRLYKGAIAKCSPSVLQEIEVARKHFPFVWIGLRGHSRVWLSQIEGLANIINSLSTIFPDLAVVFDGWGQTEKPDPRSELEMKREQSIVADIVKKISTNVPIYNLIGAMNCERAVWSRVIDFYISAYGSGLTFPLWIANKPGVVHGIIDSILLEKGEWSSHIRENAAAPLLIPNDYRDDNVKIGFANYDVDWQKINAAVIKVMNQKQKPIFSLFKQENSLEIFTIKPEQLTVVGGNLVSTENGQQLISCKDHHGLVSYGPYISLPDGLYGIKIDVEFPELSKDQPNVGLRLDVVIDKSSVVYEQDIDILCNRVEFFLDLIDAVDLEIRFFAQGKVFAINGIGLELLYKPDDTNLANYYYYYFNLGIKFEYQGKLEEAFAAYSKVALLNSPYKRAAISACQNISKVQPNSRRYANLVWDIAQQNSIPDILQQVSWWQVGDIFAQNALWERAIPAYHRAIVLEPDVAIAYAKQAETLAKENKLDTQTAWKTKFFTALLKEPTSDDFYACLAQVLIVRCKWHEAIYAYQKFLEGVDDTATITDEIYFNLGYALAQTNQLDSAVIYYQKALQINPKDAKTYYHLGLAVYRHNQFDLAIKYYEKALQISLKDYQVYLSLADCLIHNNRLDEASTYLQEIINQRDSRTYQEAVVKLADIWEKQGQSEKANTFDQKKQPEATPEGFYNTTEEWAVATKSTEYREIEPSETQYFPNEYGFISSYSFPKSFVALVSNGRYCQTDPIGHSYYISPDNKLLLDASLLPHYDIARLDSPPIYNVEGTVAVISGFNCMMYYHWLVDLLPKLGLIFKVEMPLKNIDKVLIPKYSGFHKETLDIMGIPPEKILDASQFPHIKADRLIVTPNVCHLRHTSLKFLRENLMSPVAKLSLEQPERIYISRRLARGRKIINENEVIEFLARLGFITIDGELLSVEEKISLFSGTKVVVGICGAGLTNLAFCQPGTKVIEIFTPCMGPPAQQHYYWVSYYLGLQYYYLKTSIGLGSAHLRQLIYGCDDIEEAILDINALKDLLKTIEVT